MGPFSRARVTLCSRATWEREWEGTASPGEHPAAADGRFGADDRGGTTAAADAAPRPSGTGPHRPPRRHRYSAADPADDDALRSARSHPGAHPGTPHARLSHRTDATADDLPDHDAHHSHDGRTVAVDDLAHRTDHDDSDDHVFHTHQCDHRADDHDDDRPEWLSFAGRGEGVPAPSLESSRWRVYRRFSPAARAASDARPCWWSSA